MIFFVDNDSTLMKQETFDEVIKKVHPSWFHQAEHHTQKSMNGNISLQQSLQFRIDVLKNQPQKITKTDLARWAQEYEFAEGVEDFLQKIIAKFGSLKNRFFILSGGFFESIAPKLDTLALLESEKIILKNQLFCNHFLWDEKGYLQDIDWEKSEMWQEGAKRKKIKTLSLPTPSKWIAIGDGYNDVGMIENDEEGSFYAFTGVVQRPKTIAAAKGKTISRFDDLPFPL